LTDWPVVHLNRAVAIAMRDGRLGEIAIALVVSVYPHTSAGLKALVACADPVLHGIDRRKPWLNFPCS